jgi:hypothetical protein
MTEVELEGLKLEGLAPEVKLEGVERERLELEEVERERLELGGLVLQGLELEEVEREGLELGGLMLQGLELEEVERESFELKALVLEGIELSDRDLTARIPTQAHHNSLLASLLPALVARGEPPALVLLPIPPLQYWYSSAPWSCHTAVLSCRMPALPRAWC